MPLPHVQDLGDWLHLTLLNGDDVLIAIRQLKAVHTDQASGGTALYVDKEPIIVQEAIEVVHMQIVCDEVGGTNRR